MLVDRLLFSWCSECTALVFKSRLCVGVENSSSLLIPCLPSNTFQCRWRLFCMLKALVSESMWANMVHSVPPLLGSFT